MPKITLESSDKKRITVDLEILKCSGTINGQVERLGMDGLEKEVIPIPNISGDILKKVIRWANYHKGDDPPVDGDDDDESDFEVEIWDDLFLEENEDDIVKITEAANYLEIEPLFMVCCKYMADLITDKDVHEIRRIFDIKPPQGREKREYLQDAMEVEEVERKSKKIKLSDESEQQTALPASSPDSSYSQRVRKRMLGGLRRRLTQKTSCLIVKRSKTKRRT